MLIKLTFFIFSYFLLKQTKIIFAKTFNLVSSKSYFVSSKTIFVLKCSNDDKNLIILNSVEKIKKLIDHLTNSSIQNNFELIGWNKSLSNEHFFNKKFEKLKKKNLTLFYETMFLSGKMLNEYQTFFTEKNCLLFQKFSKYDEAIFSCFYKPNIFKSLFTNIEILNEKLIYLTCIYTWPFNRDCILAKQFKLNFMNKKIEKNLNLKNDLKFKKLILQLEKICYSNHNFIQNLKLTQNKSLSLLNLFFYSIIFLFILNFIFKVNKILKIKKDKKLLNEKNQIKFLDLKGDNFFDSIILKKLKQNKSKVSGEILVGNIKGNFNFDIPKLEKKPLKLVFDSIEKT